MAHFRGIIQGNRGPASRLGSKSSGLRVEAASWDGKVVVELREVNGVDYAWVSLRPHHGSGTTLVLYDGPVSGAAPAFTAGIL